MEMPQSSFHIQDEGAADPAAFTAQSQRLDDVFSIATWHDATKARLLKSTACSRFVATSELTD